MRSGAEAGGGRGAAPWSVASLSGFYGRELETLAVDPDLPARHAALLEELESGRVRAARRDADGAWHAVEWIQRALLAGFRGSRTVRYRGAVGAAFDRAAYPPRSLTAEDAVRLVPGGSAVRRGAHLAPGVVVMPPSYVNVGAWIGPGTMVDSHVLVGSCAQVGAGVHLSAGVQLGGVLEPPGTRPVVVEDQAFLGAQSGVFEGVVVRRRAVLAPGVLLTASTVVHDLVRETTWRGEVPEEAVVVPGTRPARGAWAERHGLSLATACVVKYRDARTDAATALEGALR
jgi:2,3,4,5-tetrahydropyridine-2-carboxylate N-succinyltransferase